MVGLVGEAFVLVLSAVLVVGISQIVERTSLHPLALLATRGHSPTLYELLRLQHNALL